MKETIIRHISSNYASTFDDAVELRSLSSGINAETVINPAFLESWNDEAMDGCPVANYTVAEKDQMKSLASVITKKLH